MTRSLETRVKRLEDADRPAFDGVIVVMEQATPEETQTAIEHECAGKGVDPATTHVIVIRFVGKRDGA